MTTQNKEGHSAKTLICKCGDPDCPGGVPYSEPFSIRVEQVEDYVDEISCYLAVRTSSWQWGGERTDLHDLLSLVWAISLRVREVASVQLVSDTNGFSGIESELYARFLILKQIGEIGGASKRRAYFEALGIQSNLAYELFAEVFGVPASGPLNGDYDGATYKPQPDWVDTVAKQLRLKNAMQYEFRVRAATNWQVLTSVKRGVTVAHIGRAAMARLRAFVAIAPFKHFDGIEYRVFRTSHLVNAVSNKVMQRAERFLRAVEGNRSASPLVLPLDSHAIFLGDQTIVSIEAPCGREAFDAERLLVDQRRQAEADIFLSDAQCTWADKVDDGRFEELIKDLLEVEPGIHRVRQVGATREADDGRDLMAEWTVPPANNIVAGVTQAGAPLNERRHVLVQVKIRGRGVSRSDVINIRDTLEHYYCSGFFLVGFPRLTVPLSDHLLEMRRRGRFWVDWWQQSEVEHRLRRNPDIASRYSDIVRLHRS
ncbi:hypothetical protein [Azospirillum rugosum]|uniref:Restriction endonuclease n=1 Tax=Azospirillum rugosum TaxID=416170 RepID=A0ABS4SWZ3_9PROT|nr:hypothetical protein [Azospirillum rugosum]MBP2297077.1 hypothetical protein [Azospirillum rugosum]MDQ0530875.1 hypothetical protein [Azospirillum rugosum]